jgi:hypothetical protein
LQNPDLVEIKATTIGSKRLSEFQMNVSLRPPQAESAAKAGKAAPAAKKG